MHVAAVKVPALHELVPDTVYPLLHVGWHVDPDANELVHVPTPPLVGAEDASQFSTALQMSSALTTAASLVPSLDEAMEYQSFALPTEVSSVHVPPESVEVQMFSALTTAASLVPSLDEVMEYHFLMLPTEVFSVHVPPEFVEVQMLPL